MRLLRKVWTSHQIFQKLLRATHKKTNDDMHEQIEKNEAVYKINFIYLYQAIEIKIWSETLRDRKFLWNLWIQPNEKNNVTQIQQRVVFGSENYGNTSLGISYYEITIVHNKDKKILVYWFPGSFFFAFLSSQVEWQIYVITTGIRVKWERKSYPGVLRNLV